MKNEKKKYAKRAENVVAFTSRFPRALLEKIDAARGRKSRSRWLIDLVKGHFKEK